MLARIAALAIVGAAVAQDTAIAQTTPDNPPDKSGSTSAPSTSPDKSSRSVPQEIRDKLAKQGFSDVKVVPGSCLVTAKDKNGDPVKMIIGPNSVTTFTTKVPEQAQAPTIQE